MVNCILYISSAAIFSQNNHFITSTLYGFSSTSWKRGMWHAGINVITLDFMLMRFRVQCYSARRGRSSRSPQKNPGPSMEEETDAFYVVRKGDIVGIYKCLRDCQAQVSSSVCDPSVSVYKGYSLPKETQEYLASRGLKNALYTINAADVKEDLFGTLVPCPFQQPDGLGHFVDKPFKTTSTHQRSMEVVTIAQPDGLGHFVDKPSKKTSTHQRSMEVVTIADPISIEPPNKNIKLGYGIETRPVYQNRMSCILEFDGASKGNPGKAGAGAILRAEDGSVISRLREGLGVVTNNVAEYRALILGMKCALKKGFKQIRVQGDSQLVCMQVQDRWQTKNQNMINLCKEAKELKDMFLSFQIAHVRREFNGDADAEANLAIHLPSGVVDESSGEG